MVYQLILKPTFLDGFSGLPRDVRKRALRAVEGLQADPSNTRSKNIEKLKHAKRLWTCRVTDNYRLLYSIHPSGIIQLIDVGTHQHIDRVIEKLPRIEEKIGPGIIDDVMDPRSATTAAQIQEWSAVQQSRPMSPQESDRADEELLPMEITTDVLQRLGIPEVYHMALVDCVTANDLLSAGLPEDVFERVYSWLYSHPDVMDIAQEPNYVLSDPEDLSRYADGDLLGFLLLLDAEQEQLVSYALQGPTLVKGGPGSGKSTVALYRVRALLESGQRHSQGMTPRVLFTTYTKALVGASRQLLDQLLDDSRMVDVNTLDSIAHRIVSTVEGKKPDLARYQDWESALGSARLAFMQQSGLEYQLLGETSRLSDEYLIDEMQWVIEGQGIETLEEYLAVQRVGRSHALNPAMRRAVWSIFEHVRGYFQANHLLSWNMLRRRAVDYVRRGDWEERYDYVIVDEAQDLTPMGLNLCVHLCANPTGLFLTADASQSIYNKGFSWRRVHDELRVTGRTRILRRNYRTTRQIAEAAHMFLQSAKVGDSEVFDQRYVHAGPLPRVFGADSEMDGFEWLYQELHRAMREIRQNWGSVVILVPKNRLADSVLSFFSGKQVPVIRIRRDEPVDLADGRAKIMTMHSAKGLEFPIVAVPYMDEGQLPRDLDPDDRGYQEKLAEQRRLFYVACTRAMRRLLLIYDRHNPSPFIKEMEQMPDYWDFVASR